MKPEHNAFEVAGVDGCKSGWFVVITRVMKHADSNSSFELKSRFVAGNFREVLSKTDNCDLICVDIPIGLKDEGNGDRMCDKEARHHLGEPRRRSVFPPPVRPCLSAMDYTEANVVSQKHSGKKLTPPTFNIMDKIRQVDDLMTPELQKRVREIHPEVSFWALNNQKPMQYKKTSLNGRKERMKLLDSIFSGLERIVSETRIPRKVAPDDILDALVAAWTAAQTVIGKATILAEEPENNCKGLRMEILCPIR